MSMSYPAKSNVCPDSPVQDAPTQGAPTRDRSAGDVIQGEDVSGAPARVSAGTLARAGTQSPGSYPSQDHGDVLADLRKLSAGNIGRVGSAGPVLVRRPAERRRLGDATLEPALSRADRMLMVILAAGWLACLTVFWVWWLNPAHKLGAFGFVANSVLLAYVSLFPAIFVAAVIGPRRVSRKLRVPNLDVAFVVTRAPSEPWDIARSTLSAMLAQQFPSGYDVWLCDEVPDDEVTGWCRSNGVMISTRHQVEGYHRHDWPRRTRCKEGNLAYFYDHWGYQHYDVVAQLDCDHKPAPTYLAEVVRPFADPAVGYVAAPSVCDANADTSWSARGRVYREATFHGPFQLGHSGGRGPLCIGSHYAVRTAALRDIGGIGPELAEDFSTTFLLNSARWRGVFISGACRGGCACGSCMR